MEAGPATTRASATPAGAEGAHGTWLKHVWLSLYLLLGCQVLEREILSLNSLQLKVEGDGLQDPDSSTKCPLQETASDLRVAQN